MKLFGGFHGNRSASGKKPLPEETEKETLPAPDKSAPKEAPTPEAKTAEPRKPEAPKEAADRAEEPTRVIEPVEEAAPAALATPKETEEPIQLQEEPKPEPKPQQPVSEEPTIAWAPEKAEKETSTESTKEIHFRTPEEEAEIEEIITAYQKKKRRRRIIILAVLAALVIGGVVLWKSLVKPPEIVQPTAKPTAEPTTRPTVKPTDKPADPEVTPTEAPPEETPPPERMRRENVYTIMLVGRDQGLGNTDTIMVCVFDADAATVDVVSIPRDTCANVESDPRKAETKKISGIYSRAGFDGLREAVSEMVGFPIDCYVSVSVNGFVQLVQTIGGVYFNVPHYMNYDDPTQNLHIHFSPGEQYLDGYDAIKVVRWRQNNDGTNYGDIDRINTQQEFLKTVFKKCISLDSLVNNLDDYIKIFQEYVKTDLTTGNMTWFAKEILKLKSEDIHFYTLPTNPSVMIYGFSYGTVLPDEWLEMLNESLNPYDQPIEMEDLSLIYREEDGTLCCTSGEVKGGDESFLRMSDYMRMLEAWQASQRKDEESAASGGDTNGGE